jgi:hypothetical protein
MTVRRVAGESSPDLEFLAHRREHARPAPQGEARPVQVPSEVTDPMIVTETKPASPGVFEERLARWLADVAANGRAG